MRKKFGLGGLLALGAAASLALAGCASGGDTGGDGGDAGGTSGGGGTVTLGYVAGWTDGESMTYLLKNQLEKLGYTIDVQELTDNGPLYAALSKGDVDIYSSAWPEVTQAEYMDEFGDDIESLGAYYDNAVLTIAVPSYTDIDSLDELAANADRFGGEIIGIEPGAGLTGVTENAMMPAYGLDGVYTLETSSTSAMLTVLGDAIDKREDVVVTLWRPFWAYSEYDVKDLKDPLGAMGEPEKLHMLGHQGFGDEHPDIAELIAGIKLSDDAYGALESLVTSDEYEGDPEGAVEAWIAEHGDAFPTLLK
ncbi:MAG: glycine betaine ABC transporter substrate-binding protein [Candidatus Leucobacter sulfamidivorax]|nr:glycine betaine ABC transporter substrate-binding protein [Candidatus Leucobacter sulfamidivorax]